MKTINALLAIIRLTLRQTLNNRAALWLPAAVLMIAGVLPFLLRGDGTHEGLIRLVLTYPPVLLFGLLLTSALWLGSSLTAREITTGELQSVITKPVSSACLWLGKWLGLLLFNAALLGVAAAAYLAAVTVIHRPYADAAPLRGDQVFLADQQALFRQAKARHAALQMTAADAPPSMGQVLTSLKQETFRILPGRDFTWSFVLPADIRSRSRDANAWSLQYRFRCDGRERVPVSGRWTVAAESGDLVELPTGPILDGVHHQDLSLLPELPDGRLNLTFSNPAESAVTLFFDPQEPIILRCSTSSFGANLGRMLFVLFCFLGAAAALALTLGTLFSMPVAVFSSLALLFAITLSTVFANLAEPAHGHGPRDAAGHVISRLGETLLLQLQQATGTLTTLLPLDDFANAYHIGNHVLLLAFFMLLTVLPALLGTVAAIQLSRKEFF